jgi:transposase
MAEKHDPKELDRIQEVLMANSIMIETLTQLLMEKGMISNEEFFIKLKKVKNDYQSKTRRPR